MGGGKNPKIGVNKRPDLYGRCFMKPKAASTVSYMRPDLTRTLDRNEVLPAEASIKDMLKSDQTVSQIYPQALDDYLVQNLAPIDAGKPAVKNYGDMTLLASDRGLMITSHATFVKQRPGSLVAGAANVQRSNQLLSVPRRPFAFRKPHKRVLHFAEFFGRFLIALDQGPAAEETPQAAEGEGEGDADSDAEGDAKSDAGSDAKSDAESDKESVDGSEASEAGKGGDSGEEGDDSCGSDSEEGEEGEEAEEDGDEDKDNGGSQAGSDSGSDAESEESLGKLEAPFEDLSASRPWLLDAIRTMDVPRREVLRKAAGNTDANKVLSALSLYFSLPETFGPLLPPALVNELELQSFGAWRRSLAELAEKHEREFVITPYERNLDFWRQLWRTIERSDMVLNIADARNPLLFYSKALSGLVKDMNGTDTILCLNKADYLEQSQRQVWKEYFDSQGVNTIFYAALRELQKAQAQASAATVANAAINALNPTKAELNPATPLALSALDKLTTNQGSQPSEHMRVAALLHGAGAHRDSARDSHGQSDSARDSDSEQGEGFNATELTGGATGDKENRRETGGRELGGRELGGREGGREFAYLSGDHGAVPLTLEAQEDWSGVLSREELLEYLETACAELAEKRKAETQVACGVYRLFDAQLSQVPGPELQEALRYFRERAVHQTAPSMSRSMAESLPASRRAAKGAGKKRVFGATDFLTALLGPIPSLTAVDYAQRITPESDDHGHGQGHGPHGFHGPHGHSNEFIPADVATGEGGSARVTVGVIGFPNVGKSTFVNSLAAGSGKRVSVSVTPGKTKHLQTLLLADSELVSLCDCPGMVLPVCAFSEAELLLNGTINPATYRGDLVPTIEAMLLRVSDQIGELYGLRKEFEVITRRSGKMIWELGNDVLEKLALNRGYLCGGRGGSADIVRTARLLLRQYLDGKIIAFSEVPPTNADNPLSLKEWKNQEQQKFKRRLKLIRNRS